MQYITAALIALAVAAPASLAQEAPPTLDQLLEIEPAPPKPGATPDPSNPSRPDPINPDELTDEGSADDLENLINEMLTVSRRLGDAQDPGLQTQRSQETIMSYLDKLIAAARRQKNSGGGGGGAGAEEAGASSSTSGGSGAASTSGSAANAEQSAAGASAGTSAGGAASAGGPPAGNGASAPQQGPIQETRVEWGHLPERMRDQLQEGIDERFSAVYRSLTEQYYRRLAEEAN